MPLLKGTFDPKLLTPTTLGAAIQNALIRQMGRNPEYLRFVDVGEDVLHHLADENVIS